MPNFIYSNGLLSVINRLAVMRGSGDRYSDGLGQFLGLGDRDQDNDPVNLHRAGAGSRIWHETHSHMREAT